MTRPLMQHGVGQLEQMFANGKADPKVLKQLENELQNRQVPRAVALLAKVQAAIYGKAVAPQVSTGSPTVPTLPVPFSVRPLAPAQVSQQPDLWGQPAAPLIAAERPAAPICADTPTVTPPQARREAAGAPAPPPAMSLVEAYKVLTASPGAAWESIEHARRRLVQQSHPARWKTQSAAKNAQTLTEAREINAAYAALSQARCCAR